MTNSGLLLLLTAFSFVSRLTALRLEDVVVVVISQADSYNSRLAQDLKTSLQQQASALGEKGAKVRLTHEEFDHPGTWTVFPILPRLYEIDGSNSSWIIFCEERTRFDLAKLVSVLSQYDHTTEMWLGHGLYDQKPTIIHHFAFAGSPSDQVQYPLLAAGFAISNAIFKSLALKAKTEKKSGFSIDAMHELAKTVDNPLLSLPSVFCLEKNHSDCATYPLPFRPCGEPVPNEDIYFAVKTCLKFHKYRVPAVQQTWGKDAANIEFFSDVQDESIPTTSVGVANTNVGHCAKTKAILRLMLERAKRLPNLQWIVLADDDTLLSVLRLRQLLSCWKGEELVVGERYGYGVYNPYGYNYPTGGGGVVISTAVLPILAHKLSCQTDDSPDDMYLGFWLAHLKIPLIHSPFFHQARPTDYPQGYLATQVPVSFHKHWMTDPLATYHQWFASPHGKNSPSIHTEL